MIVTILRAILRGLQLPGEAAIVTWRSVHLAPLVAGDPVAIELSRTAFATSERVVRLTPAGVVVATVAIGVLRAALGLRAAIRTRAEHRRERRAAWRASRAAVRAIIRATRDSG